MSVRTTWRHAVGVAVSSLVVVTLVLVVWSRREALEPLRDLPLRDLAFVAFLVAFGHYLNALEFCALFRAAGARIGVTENWLLFTAGQLMNYLPGQVGTLYRLRYLRSVHDLAYSRSSAGYGINLVLTVLATGVVGFGATILVGLGGGDLSWVLLAIFAGLVVAALVGTLVPLPTTQRSGRMGRAWTAFRAGWTELQDEWGVAALVLGLELLKYVVAAWRLQITFRWLGFDEPYAFFLVLAPVIGLATFIGITPAALGFREVMVTGAAAALGLSLSEGLLGATLDRGVLLVVSVVLGSIGLVASERRVRAVARSGPTAG